MPAVRKLFAELLAAMRSGFTASVVAVGLGLVGSLTASGYFQYRQFELLNNSDQFRILFLSYAAYQLQKEALRLGHEVHDALLNAPGTNPEDLTLRYEVMVSRLKVLEQAVIGTDKGGRDRIPGYRPAIEAVHRLVDFADPILGSAQPPRLDDARLRDLLQRLEALEDPLADLATRTHQHATRASEDVNRSVAEQTRFSVALTLLQCALLLGLALLSVRQIRLMREKLGVEQLAQRLQEARLEAEAANRAKSAFLANMSHELRTPFHGMLGMMALLEQTPLGDKQLDFLHTAQGSARHLLTILNDILDISKLESGKLEITPGPVELRALFDEIKVPMEPLALGKGLALHFDLAPDLPAWVTADGIRVKQILFNLVSNAIKFTERGSVRVVARPAATGICIDVIDTGIGIDAAVLPRLFSRFEQADTSRLRAFGGTGLGLEISRSLARMMGGDISIRSTPGAGTTLTVELPLGAAPPPARTAADEPAPPGAGAFTGLRVLACEDHPVNRKYLAALLERLGIAAEFVENGREAVERVAQACFDLVLMDVHMPEMDGLAATRAIRALPREQCNVKIIALTADAFEEARNRALEAGMDDFVAKPVDPDVLARAIARHIAPRSPAPQAAQGAEAPAEAAGAAADSSAQAARAKQGSRWYESEQAQAAEAAGWVDLKVIRSLALAMPPKRYAAIAAMLREDQGGSLRALREAMRSGDLGRVRQHAHSLKSAAGSLGLKALAQSAAAIESDTRAGNAPTLSIERLEADLEASFQAVQSIVGP